MTAEHAQLERVDDSCWWFVLPGTHPIRALIEQVPVADAMDCGVGLAFR
jgi:hypothetical protein